MSADYPVTAAAGTLRSGGDAAFVVLPHVWTRSGIEVHAEATGAHLLHLAVATCVLNDLYREAERLDLPLRGARVRAAGGFGGDWSSTGVTYAVEVDCSADAATVEALLARVDEVAEIPRALRSATTVERMS